VRVWFAPSYVTGGGSKELGGSAGVHALGTPLLFRGRLFPLVVRFARTTSGVTSAAASKGRRLVEGPYRCEDFRWLSMSTWPNARTKSIYTGHSDNLEARLAAHDDGRFRGYTYKRRPVRLIFHEAFATREEAFAAEREIKGWSWEKKWALARRDWQVLKELSVRRTPRRWLAERGGSTHPSSKPQDEREAASP